MIFSEVFPVISARNFRGLFSGVSPRIFTGVLYYLKVGAEFLLKVYQRFLSDEYLPGLPLRGFLPVFVLGCFSEFSEFTLENPNLFRISF